MKRNSPRRKLDAFTAFELIICIVIVFLLVVLLLPQFSSRPTVRASRIHCVSNLKITGLGFRMWSNDHNDQMPMMVSTNRRGSLEFIATGEVIRHFLAISNELSSPKVLACADDKGVKRATNFSLLTSKNVSYFVGLDADETKMQMLLSGDHNITNGLPPNTTTSSRPPAPTRSDGRRPFTTTPATSASPTAAPPRPPRRPCAGN